MLELICKRLLLAVPTLLLVSMMVFGLQKLLPGDPLIAMAGEERDPAVIAQLRAELNLDAPIPVQYFHWLTRALQGDLGVSLRTHEPVTQLIASKLPVTLELSLLAMIIALVFGISMGILAAVNKNSWGELRGDLGDLDPALLAGDPVDSGLFGKPAVAPCVRLRAVQ